MLKYKKRKLGQFGYRRFSIDRRTGSSTAKKNQPKYGLIYRKDVLRRLKLVNGVFRYPQVKKLVLTDVSLPSYATSQRRKNLAPKLKKVFVKHIKRPSKALVIRSKICNQIAVDKFNSSQKLVRARNYLSNNPLVTFVFLPWLIFAFYLLFIKTPVYEATARVVVEKNAKDTSMMINLGFLGKSGGGLDSQSTLLTKEYIQSRDMFSKLSDSVNLKQHYQAGNIDYFSRLSFSAKENKSLEYYQKMVEAVLDTTTNEIAIYARAYDPQYAYQLISEVIENTKEFANRISNSLASEQEKFAEQQLMKAKKKLYTAEQALLSFQNEHEIFDPKETIKEVSSVMAKLKGSLVEKQTQLISLSAFMSNRSSKIVALKKEIEALKTQIKSQTKALLGKDADPLNSVYAKFQWLELSLKFAVAEYEASQQALNIAKVELSKQQQLVLEVMPPRIPDDYEYPHTLYDLFSLLVALLVFYSIGRMTYIIVQEHID